MRRIGITIGVTVMLIASATVFGASAFTTATVDRDTNLDVVTDNNAVIGLTAGSSGMVTQTSGGEVTIDSTVSGATGVNGNASFTIGNNSSATSTYAIKITNNAGTSKDFTISYSGFVTSDSAKSLQFELYNSTGSHLATIEQGATSHTVSGLADGSSIYVVVEIKTTNGDLGSSHDLSGTLTVSA
ncbi:MAG: hypothetical protein ABEH47_02080 [Haloferacaceae archaeon]